MARIDITRLDKVKSKIEKDLDHLLNAQNKIKDLLKEFSDSKLLKGDELTGWLGEIYCKILFNGTLVDESNEHDFVEQVTGKKYAVKARKSDKRGWNVTSAISKIEGQDCPDFLLFIHFTISYEVKSIWKYEWQEIFRENRFKPKKVRGSNNRWVFIVSKKKDKKHLIYSI